MTKAALLASALLFAAPALAGPREDTLAGISRCSALPDDRSFLDCIYGAAQPMRARLGLPPASPAQTRLVPPAYAAPAAPVAPRAVPPGAARPAGGLANVLGNDSGASWMETFSFDHRGLFTVTFSNGQVWRQEPSDPARARWAGRPSDYSIRLAVNADGRSGTLWVRGDATTYQVRKLR